ncbi:MAG: hypothetical protein ACE15E_04110 [Acidobacteriota bacterium]
MPKIRNICLTFSVLLVLGSISAFSTAQSGNVGNREIKLENEYLKAVFTFGPGGVHEAYYARRNGKDLLLAQGRTAGGVGATFLAADPDTGDRSQIAPDLTQFSKDLRARKVRITDIPPEPKPGPRGTPLTIQHESASLRDKGQTLQLTGKTADGDRVVRTISLRPGERFVSISVVLESKRALLLEYFNDRLRFGAAGRPDFTWTPLAKTGEEDVFPDWSWKAPATILYKGNLGLALVPGVTDLVSNNTWRHCNLTMDLDARPEDGPAFSFGLAPTRPHRHSAFKHIPGQRALIPAGRSRYAYCLLALPEVPSDQAHRPLVQFLWERFGHPNLLGADAAQKHTFSEWRRKTWHTYADQQWWEFERNGVPCGSIRIEVGDPQNGWFCAWWNSLHSTFGMARYAMNQKDSAVRDKAGKILNLALDAPVNQGAFPVVFLETAMKGQHWQRDHFFGGIGECYHAFDMAWMGYWLLRWHKEVDPKDDRIMPRCIQLGDFLCRQQQATGFIPSYFNEDLSVRANTRLNQESSEPAGCAVFLVELYKSTGNQKYLQAAIKAMEYIEKYIIPEQKWFDFETFLSCSRKPYDFYDPITGQNPQNNMGTIQAAKAYLALFDATKESRFLDLGMNVLDYLSLTQQVWSHPLMSPNLVGGFTTQNTDAEWSDARQAYCAVVYLDYFDRTGKREYLERGIGALRAGFAVAPYENWAHTGFHDDPGALSGFHWGQGTAMAAVEQVWDRFGDVFADARAGWGYGVNGCTVRDFAVKGRSISMRIDTKLKWDQPLRIVFRDAPEGTSTIRVNGSKLGDYSQEDLKRGIHWVKGR